MVAPMSLSAEEVKARRRELGLTQPDLVRISGVSRRSITRIESGERVSELVERVIAQALGLHFNGDASGTADGGSETPGT